MSAPQLLLRHSEPPCPCPQPRLQLPDGQGLLGQGHPDMRAGRAQRPVGPELDTLVASTPDLAREPHF